MMVLPSMRIFKRNMAEFQISAMYVSLYQRLHGRYYSQLWQLEKILLERDYSWFDRIKDTFIHKMG
jgi:hypothetical protein